MNIQNNSNTIFTSRNETIRFADKIARKSHNLYDTVSSSRIRCYRKIDDYKFLESYIFTKTIMMRQMKDKLYNYAQNFFGKIEALINPIRLHKVANCGEKAHIACIMAKLLGIKDCHLAHLFKANGRDLDHAVLFVSGEKPYIIDAWLGFADYVPNALTRYKAEYKQFLDIKDDDTLTFASKYDDEFTDFLKDDFTRKQRKEIKKMYPELVLHK